MRLDLRHLRILVLVADYGSITKAAQALRIAQPGLSSQLSRIEHALGARVFDRTNDGVVLTDFGQYATARAAEVLTAFDAVLADLKSVAVGRQPVGPVRIGGSSATVAPILVAGVHELLGRDVVTVTDHQGPRMVKQLAAGELDLAVLDEFPGFPLTTPDNVELRTLVAAEPIFVMVAEGHRLAGQDEIDLAELAGEDWCIPPVDDTGLITRFRLVCQAAGFTPRLRHEVRDSTSAKSLVATGQAVGCLYPTSLGWPGVVVRPFKGSPHYRRLVLGWRRASEIGELGEPLYERAFAGYLKAVARAPHYARWWAEHGAGALAGRTPPETGAR